MAKKNVRNMKVCGQSGYKYETVPAITLKGKWLEELDFILGITGLFIFLFEVSNFYVTNITVCAIIKTI